MGRRDGPKWWKFLELISNAERISYMQHGPHSTFFFFSLFCLSLLGAGLGMKRQSICIAYELTGVYVINACCLCKISKGQERNDECKQ
jgi:hypothetical protein